MDFDRFENSEEVSDAEDGKTSSTNAVQEIVTLPDGTIMIGGVRYKRTSMKSLRKQSNVSLPESCKRRLIELSHAQGMALNESVEEAINGYLSVSTERYLPYDAEESVLVTYYVSDGMEKALKDRASLEDRPISQIVRKAIYEYLKQRLPEDSE